MLPVYIYSGRSIDPECARSVCSNLRAIGVEDFSTVTDSLLNNALRLVKQATLIIPGGHTYALSTEIKESGLTKRIKSAVRNGWNYLGLCAGGNFACATIVESRFHGEIDAAVEGIQFLNLLPLNGLVPCSPHIYKPFSKGGTIKVTDINRKPFYCFWQDGSKFEVIGPGLSPAAFYEDTSIAAASGKYGLGNVFVTGIHPEIITPLPDNCDAEEITRREFMQRMFTYVGITQTVGATSQS